VKWDNGFVSVEVFLNCEIRFPQLLDARRTYVFYVPWCTPVPVGNRVILRILAAVPTKPIQNILERVNHGLFISEVCDWV